MASLIPGELTVSLNHDAGELENYSHSGIGRISIVIKFASINGFLIISYWQVSEKLGCQSGTGLQQSSAGSSQNPVKKIVYWMLMVTANESGNTGNAGAVSSAPA